MPQRPLHSLAVPPRDSARLQFGETVYDKVNPTPHLWVRGKSEYIQDARDIVCEREVSAKRVGHGSNCEVANVSRQPSGVDRQPSAVSGQPSAVSRTP